jgi:hypothetical protein
MIGINEVISTLMMAMKYPECSFFTGDMYNTGTYVYCTLTKEIELKLREFITKHQIPNGLGSNLHIPIIVSSNEINIDSYVLTAKPKFVGFSVDNDMLFINLQSEKLEKRRQKLIDRGLKDECPFLYSKICISSNVENFDISKLDATYFAAEDFAFMVDEEKISKFNFKKLSAY